MRRVLLLFCTGVLSACFLSGCTLPSDGHTEVADSVSVTETSGEATDSTAADNKVTDGTTTNDSPTVNTTVDGTTGSMLTDNNETISASTSAAETDAITTVSTVTGSAETTNPALKDLRETIALSGGAVGVAFIGYVKSESTETTLRTYLTDSEIGKTYSFLRDAPLFMTEGQEFYAIVPVDDKGRITVYASALTDNGEYADNKDKPLYTGEPGEVILLRCNLSEIYSNVLVTAADGGGAVEFRPAVSLRDGHLQECTGVYDFSVYSDDEGLQDDVMNSYGLLLETDEVKYRIDSGMTLQYTGQTQVIDGRTCYVYALGTDHDDQFVREFFYGVCGDFVYSYDAVSDTWNRLGAG